MVSKKIVPAPEPKMVRSLFAETLAAHRRAIDGVETLLPTIERVGEAMIEAIESGGKVCWAGNGGSAADAQHLAAELVGRFEHDRPALPSIALTTNPSLLTAVGNDYGFEQLFARQVEALCRPPDLLVAISTSGRSENILAALRRAGELGVTRVALSGRDGGEMPSLSEFALVVPVDNTARIQEAHILIGHMLCDLVERHWVLVEPSPA